MTNSRMLLSMASLCVLTLLWPPSSLAQKPLSAHEKLCREEMTALYKRVEAFEMSDAWSNDRVQASISGKAHDTINLYLPRLKDNCPSEAKSVRDLENGAYLRKLAAAREKRRKADERLKKSDPDPADEDLMDLLETQR